MRVACSFQLLLPIGVNPTESVGKQKIANGAADRFPNERKILKIVWRKMRGEKFSDLAFAKHLSPSIFRQQQAATLTANAFRCKGRSVKTGWC
jgi:hypothetical protein